MLDERFIMHRYMATRFATVVGTVMMAGWVIYEMVARSTVRWDLLVILAAMAVAKVGAMFYYRRSN